MSVTAIETTERAAQPLEPTTAANGSGLLQLIEKVVSNPEISVEKVQALLNMQIELENRNAEKEFDRALVAAQTEIRALAWDKFNQTNQSRNVSYPKIEAMLKPIREKYGFVQSYDTEPHPTPD